MFDPLSNNMCNSQMKPIKSIYSATNNRPEANKT